MTFFPGNLTSTFCGSMNTRIIYIRQAVKNIHKIHAFFFIISVLKTKKVLQAN